jgi:hypothetical protein
VTTADVQTEYAAQFGDGYVGPEQGSLEAAKAYVRIFEERYPDVHRHRQGIAGIVMRTVTTSEWQPVDEHAELAERWTQFFWNHGHGVGIDNCHKDNPFIKSLAMAKVQPPQEEQQ